MQLAVQTTVDMIKALVPRSFAKTFEGMNYQAIYSSMELCIGDLSREQIGLGLQVVRDRAFCPDPALFRRWCLGQVDFSHSDAIADSYIGKSGALGNLVKWLENDKRGKISVAEKQAYDQTYHLWQNWRTDGDKYRAENAFKDAYQFIVNRLVRDGVACSEYVPPTALGYSENSTHTPASDAYINDLMQRYKP
ncbi:hypothetical protein ACFBZI_08475 [Moraxella sp. ZJ142]|uniref:hypothetical protein n=1 Tax=Moraxella marmotae TaxID=3344520 RepID=UPI0035D448E6